MNERELLVKLTNINSEVQNMLETLFRIEREMQTNQLSDVDLLYYKIDLANIRRKLKELNISEYDFKDLALEISNRKS